MKKMDYGKISVTTTGGAGAATGSQEGDMIFQGKLYAVYLDYHGSAPATTDVTVKVTGPVAQNLIVVSDNNTDGWYLPRADTHDTTGADRLYASGGENVAEPMPVCGKITIDVAQADALTDCVVAHVYVEQ
jgi:hypothetical protein